MAESEKKVASSKFTDKTLSCYVNTGTGTVRGAIGLPVTVLPWGDDFGLKCV